MKSLFAALILSLAVLAAFPQHACAQDAGPQGAASPQTMPGGGMMRGKGMMGRGPMAGCPGMPACAAAGMPCMGGGMGMGMGGMGMGMGMMDPKTHAEMMQIRGRAMVEMGNLMIKRGKELEQQKPPAQQ